jgi:hypothetical protein
MTQWCGPSKLVLTFEDEGFGKFSQKEIDNMVVKDWKGTVVGLNLPKKAVVISNHQAYPFESPCNQDADLGSDLCGLVVRLVVHIYLPLCCHLHSARLISLFTFTGTSKDVYIVLKQSLKWIPFVGWVCRVLASPGRRRDLAARRACNSSASSSSRARGSPTASGSRASSRGSAGRRRSRTCPSRSCSSPRAPS